MWNLKNKTVVISGATNGIGKAAAIELSKENPKLLFTYRNQGLADKLLAEIKDLSPDTQVHSVYIVIFQIKTPSKNVRMKLMICVKRLMFLLIMPAL